MTTFLFPLLAFFLVWAALLAFYVLYIAGINVWERRAVLNKKVLVISSPALILMLVVDALMNVTLFALIFWDLPKEPLVTGRLKRYLALSDSESKPGTQNARRKKWAYLLCTRALDPMDPTRKHC